MKLLLKGLDLLGRLKRFLEDAVRVCTLRPIPIPVKADPRRRYPSPRGR